MTIPDRGRGLPRDLASPRLGLALALLAAALLRFWSLHHGVPFGVEVDEPEVMERAVRMMKTADFNPHFFDYPALYMYVQAIAAVFRFLAGAIHGQWRSLADAPVGDFYLWGRGVTALAGTASVWLLYRAGMRFGRQAALLGAVLLAVMPLHVRESHYVLTDVPATFFVTLTLLLSLRASEHPTRARFILAGAAAGLAGATKYNALLAVLMPLVACALAAADSRNDAAAAWRARFEAVALTLAAMAGAFLLAAPYTLLDLPTFLNQFARLAADYRNPASLHEPIWLTGLKHLRNALDWRDAWPANAIPLGAGSLFAVAGVILGVWRSFFGTARMKWLLVTVFPILYFWFVTRQNIHYARYLLPLVPSLSLLAATAVVQVVTILRASRAIRYAVAAAVVVITIVPPAYTSTRFDADQAKVWTTELAYDWIRQNIPRGASITLEARALLPPPDYKTSIVKQLRQHGIDYYAGTGTDYLVASSQCYGPYLDDPKQYPTEYADYQTIFGRTKELARFRPSSEHPGPELRILKVVR